MDAEKQKTLERVIARFSVDGQIMSVEEYGSGHINDTYLVRIRPNDCDDLRQSTGEDRQQDTEERTYILQRMNTEIFKNTDELMENIMGVTAFLEKKISARGGDPGRETLHVIPTGAGEAYYRDAEGSCYRMYDFIREATSFDAVKRPEDFYESAVAFGNFQSLLADYPAETLHETIPDFHNTGKRYQTFLQALKEDVGKRAAGAQPEIAFVLEREKEMTVLTDALEHGELPLRVTHNDTKLNNIMIDNATGKGICVIDLDTVMPGLSVNDFGDSIRFGANTAAEDEPDVSKVSLDLKLYELYVKGYLEGCQGALTGQELAMLPMGAKMMTLECGMRFLTDYLQGDVYFKIHKENHNLIRCRTQFALVADMERKWEQMKEIVKKYPETVIF